ncbi:MAG: hypothetical protein J4G05_11825 [Chlorobi bacterium]|nr:hypothetical protein [Chlorobiota bacterium]
MLSIILLTAPQVIGKAQAPLLFSQRVGSEIDSIERDYFQLFPKYQEGFTSAHIQKGDSLPYAIRIIRTQAEMLPQDTTLPLNHNQLLELRRFIDYYEFVLSGDSSVRWGLLYTFATVLDDNHITPSYTFVNHEGNVFRYKLLSLLDSGILFVSDVTGYQWNDPLTSVSYMPISEIYRVRSQGTPKGYKTGAIWGGLVGIPGSAFVFSRTDQPLFALNLLGASLLVGGAIGESSTYDQEVSDSKSLQQQDIQEHILLGNQLPLEMHRERVDLTTRSNAFAPQEHIDLEFYHQPFSHPKFTLGLSFGQPYTQENLSKPSGTSSGRRVFISSVAARPYSLSFMGRFSISPDMRLALRGEYDIGNLDSYQEVSLDKKSIKPTLDIVVIQRNRAYRLADVSVGIGFGIHATNLSGDYQPFEVVDTFLVDYSELSSTSSSFSFLLRIQAEVFITEHLSLFSTIEPEYFVRTSTFDESALARGGISRAIIFQEVEIPPYFRLGTHTGIALHLWP